MAKGKQEVENFSCICCGKAYPESDYYKSHSPHYYIGRLPACRECISRLYDTYSFKYNDSKMAVKRICMLFDIWWSNSEFSNIDIDDPDLIKKYINRVNRSQYRGRTFDTSIEMGFDIADVIEEIREAIPKTTKGKKTKTEKNVEKKPSAKMSSPTLIKKWGSGFTPSEYQTLEDHYHYLKKANPNCDSNQEIFIVDLCYTKMQQLKAVQQGRVDDYNKLTDSYTKSFKAAGLKTVSDDTTVNEDSWSAWTSIVSQYTPEEYYRNKKLYKDIDGIGEYYERHAIRPLRNILDGTEIRDSEYFVHEDGEDYE